MSEKKKQKRKQNKNNNSTVDILVRVKKTTPQLKIWNMGKKNKL